MEEVKVLQRKGGVWVTSQHQQHVQKHLQGLWGQWGLGLGPAVPFL